MDHKKLSHSISLTDRGESGSDQNRYRDLRLKGATPSAPHIQPMSSEASSRGGASIGSENPRLTKSQSWFNSLSRRASRHDRMHTTPLKKRSFAAFTTNTRENIENVEPDTGGHLGGAARPRLNKSDWDVRKTHGMSLTPGEVSPSPGGIETSRSTDCLDLDGTCAGMRHCVSDVMSKTGNTTLSPIRNHKTLWNGATSPSTVLTKLHQRQIARRTSNTKVMRKYHAMIRLNNSSINSNSDLSTLDLANINESGVSSISATSELDLMLNISGSDIGSLGHSNLYYTIDSRRLASKHKKSQHDRKLLYGVKQFNLEPGRGLKYLEESGFVEHTPESVAKFLFRQERMSKKQIGKYLGSHLEFNKAVLEHFVKCHEFSQLLLVQALRQFLWSFRLPGEAMQIDRVMDAFAAHYCSQNPQLFEERDTCFILSFSIIMLNTALHNPNAKMKITAEQFIKQNKGINSGRDLDPNMLDAIFRNIKEEPFKIPDETYDDLMYTFFSPEREGWLMKQGGSWKTWKRRWFVLNDRCLYYFEHTAENVPKGIIPLENVRVRSLDDKDTGKQYVFEIYSEMTDIIKGCKTDSQGTVVQGNHKHYRLSAASEEDRNEWIQCIQESIRDNPFHRIISEKKAAIRRRSCQRTPAKTDLIAPV